MFRNGVSRTRGPRAWQVGLLLCCLPSRLSFLIQAIRDGSDTFNRLIKGVLKIQAHTREKVKYLFVLSYFQVSTRDTRTQPSCCRHSGAGPTVLHLQAGPARAKAGITAPRVQGALAAALTVAEITSLSAFLRA